MAEFVRRLTRKRPRRKVLLLGDAEVGKSALVHALSGKPLMERYTRTVVNNSLHKLSTDKQDVDLAVWDVGGAAEYSKLRTASANQCHLVVLCYDLTKRSSLRVAKKQWLEEVKGICPETKTVLIGCKADLVQTSSRTVSKRDVRSMAKSIRALQSYTLSATDTDQVKKTFAELAALAMYHGKEYKQSRCTLL